jgi:H+/Cl- antiporter ClcA
MPGRSRQASVPVQTRVPTIGCSAHILVIVEGPPAMSDPASTGPATVPGMSESAEPVPNGPVVHPYVHVIVVAFIGAVAVLAWLLVFEFGSRLLWENEVILGNPWLFPAICLPFSLLVGLLVKHRDAPTNLDESLIDSLAGDTSTIDWRGLPVNVVMAWASLFSGAVLGPEGGIGGIASKIAVLYADKVGVPARERSRLVFSTLASAYNGLVASPLFTAVLGTELIPDPAARTRNLPANLIGGSIGFLVFFAIGGTGIADVLHLTETGAIGPAEVLLVVPMALLGLILAVVTGGLMKVAAASFGRLKDREVERALVAGVIFSAVGMVAPILLFSGETQVQEVVADPAKYGPWLLVAMALVKMALLAVAFKSGFLGGPTFPAIFASTCVALAVSQVFPDLRVDVLIGGVMAGFLMVLFRAPLMVILLTTVMLQASPELSALIVLAAATVLIALPPLEAVMARRRAPTAA